MRVAYVCTDPGVPVFGRKGASVHVQAVLTALLRRGAEVDLMSPRPGGKPPVGLAAVRVHELPRAEHADPALREVAAQQADARVAAVLDRLRSEHPLDLVYERYALWGRTASAWARRHHVPHLLEVNAPLVTEQARHRTLVDIAGAEEVATAAMSAASTVICVSDPVADWARRYVRNPSVVHTLANGVDTSRIIPAPAGPPAAPSSEFTIGFVGTLKPWHGVETLLEATALLVADDPSYRVLLVGDGPLADVLRARADQLGIAEQVEMTGALDPDRIPAQLHRCQVAVAPYPASADFYFSPLKLYEYLAAGVPVVASRVGDLPETLQDGRLGVLVSPGQPRELADAIAGLRADPARRSALARAGRAQAVRHHDWSRVVTRALRLAGVGDSTDRPPALVGVES
ncbi:MAG: glycosyltransferase family 4 protein [Microlunatus sp.]|nr:glycosyltransferase family 4 protein [Microlunatus sp.]MDN5769466.1 glycosyltransferase family 4 protein [Microlunatus sp.]